MLDLAPVVEGSTAADALANSTDLVQVAERLGYRRYWVAEHHNMPGIASSSPPVLLAHLAAHSNTIRLGSGGVMLPNHSPLAVAEQFGTLVALHPDRIDLALGRAPGTDPLTAQALRRGRAQSGHDEFPGQLAELIGYFTGEFPEGHPFARVLANPGLGFTPSIWILGSSDYGARLAGRANLPYAFAHHFAPANTMAAARIYQQECAAAGHEPALALGVNVICAPTAEEAEWLAGPARLAMARLRHGRPGRFPSPEDVAAHQWTPSEREVVADWSRSQVLGDPAQVVAQLDDLSRRTGAQELIITTTTFRHSDRVRSYRLIAEHCDGWTAS